MKYLTVILGLYILSLGAVLFVKSTLGIPPISCINYVLSLHTPMTLGVATFVVNVLFIFVELLLLRGIGTRRDYLENIMAWAIISAKPMVLCAAPDPLPPEAAYLRL